MDLASSLQTLWRRKWLIVLAALAAVALSVTITYRVSLSPFELKGRGFVYGAAETTLLVDSSSSTLSDSATSLSPINQRAVIVAASLDSAVVRAGIAEALGLDPGEIALSASLPGGSAAGTGVQRASELAQSRADYKGRIESSQATPLIRVFTEAPTAREAGRLADSIARSGREYIRELPLPRGASPLVLRQISPSVSGTVNPGSDRESAVVIGLGSFLGLSMILLLLARAVSDVRDARRSAPAPHAAAGDSA